MKKTLEAALVISVLALGFYVVRRGLAWKDGSARPPVGSVPSVPGPDLENPEAAPAVRPERGVGSLPMVKLAQPPTPPRRAAVPPPSSSGR